MLVDDVAIDQLIKDKAKLPTIITYCTSLLNVLHNSGVSFMLDKWLH